MTASTVPTSAPASADREAARRRSSHEARSGERRRRLLGYIPMALLGMFFLFPLLFMFVSSFKPDAQILSDVDSAAAFLPVGDISGQNYSDVFDRVPVGRFLLNSIVISVLVVGMGLVINSMAGFALSRLEWRGRKLLLTVVIATLIVPFETIAVPMVYWVSKLPTIVFEGAIPRYDFGWLNSYEVQIVPFIANAFAIFLFTQSFSTIPKSFDEAARIDGAGWFTIYRRIIVPLSGPAFATVAILTFLPAWNQYLWPLMVVQDEEKRPVMIGLQYFFQLNPAWGEIMAYSSLITVPVLVMFLAFQRAFVSSIASSGVKG